MMFPPSTTDTPASEPHPPVNTVFRLMLGGMYPGLIAGL